jgi:riboflavin kinase / FMN adenylyltransferase
MTIYKWDHFFKNPPDQKRKAVMSVGVFDGIHRGHRFLLNTMQQWESFEKWVFTFSLNPRKVLRPELFPGDITSLDQKLAIFEQLGMDKVVLIDFSTEFSTLSGREFLFSIVKRVPVRKLVVGDNFRCGRMGDTSAYTARDILGSLGIDVIIPAPVVWNGKVVSSTRIRTALQEGDLLSAFAMTERAYVLDVANKPQRSGSGAIKIERDYIQQVLPPPGLYSAEISQKAGETMRKTISIDESSITWPENKTMPVKTIEFVHNEE